MLPCLSLTVNGIPNTLALSLNTTAMKTLQFDSSATGPLSDVRVVDLSRLVSGNMLTHVLADMGADVIKIEHPTKGDDLRKWRVEGAEVFWDIYARNKRSLALDLKSAEDHQLLRRLLQRAHALVENFTPGTLEKLGLSPETLLELNPKLVIVRVSGWGQTGNWRDKPGFGTLIEAMSGFAHLNGYPDRPPALPPLATADMVAGLYGAFALLTALRVAQREGGKGQVVDISLFEPIFSFLSTEAAQYSITGQVTNRAGNQSTHTAPRNVYGCSDGKYVALSGAMQSMTERLFTTIGRPELITDPRFRSNDERVANRDQLDAIIGEFIARRTQQENLDLFAAAGVTVGPIRSVPELLEDEFVLTREVLVKAEGRDGDARPMHNIVPRLSRTPGVFMRPAPAIGEHNAEIKRELDELDGVPVSGSAR
jgi:crotonobetainyl-CoA:carnitine CoA-transferase CaiB-like acyl-CoA transferase